MKRIGLLSDTHSFLDERIKKHLKDCDEIWHAGDVGDVRVIEKLEQFKPVRGVYGNIDDHEIRLMWPKEQFFEIEGMKVLMTHIAGKPYKYKQEAYRLIEYHKPNIFVCGHSHILIVQYDKNIESLLDREFFNFINDGIKKDMTVNIESNGRNFIFYVTDKRHSIHEMNFYINLFSIMTKKLLQ